MSPIRAQEVPGSNAPADPAEPLEVRRIRQALAYTRSPPDACAPSLFPCASSVLLFPRPLMLLPRRVCKCLVYRGWETGEADLLFVQRALASAGHIGRGFSRVCYICMFGSVYPNAVDADTQLCLIHAVMSQTVSRVKRNVRVQRTAQASTRFYHPSKWAVWSSTFLGVNWTGPLIFLLSPLSLSLSDLKHNLRASE